MGLGGLVCLAHVGLCDPSGPCWSSGIGGPHYGTLRNLLEPPVQYRKILNFSGNPENDFPYMYLILRTIPDLLVTSWIPSETPNKVRLHTIFKSTYATSNLKRVTLRFANYADMVETPLRAITNSEIWRSIMGPT
jgi:hypothetical protein